MSTVIDPIALCTDLVQTPSVSGDVGGMRAVQDTVIAALREEVHGVIVRRGGDALPWSLITVPGRRRGTLFACHTDTVPTGPKDAWAYDPFDGAVREGSLHGRGAVDMKGGLAATVAGLVAAAARGYGGHLLMTADEEVGSRGAHPAARAIADLELDGIVVPEATALRVRCSHRGAAWIRLRSRGVSAHGSAPQRGINAVLRLSAAVAEGTASAPLRTDEVLGSETLSVGTFHGGVATNIVPDLAEATIDQRTVGDAGALHRHWAAIDGIDEVTTILELAPLLTDRSSSFVRRIPAPIDTDPVSYFTDASVLQTQRPDVPIVIWGPGDPSQMHAVGEHIPSAQILTAAHLFAELLVSGPSARP